MKQKQHIFQSWAIEVITVLLASTISFPVSDALDVQLSILPFVMVACYVALKLIYHLCLSLSAHIISLASLFHHKPTQSDRQTEADCTLATAMSAVDNNIQMKRMELFHYEYQHEEQQYLQQKPYCNTPEIHSGSLTLAKKKSSKSANVSDTLSPISKLLM